MALLPKSLLDANYNHYPVAEEVVEGLNSVGRQVVVVLNCMNSMTEVVVHVDWAMRPKSVNLMGEARAEPTTYGPFA